MATEHLNDDALYLALHARDARFDGRFFTAVKTTGVYCRPVCRVKTPLRKNCLFYTYAAQAEAAGFRPCMRCRPELAPQALQWSSQDATKLLAQDAARLLDRMGLSNETPSVLALAERLGVSDRHLRRIFEAHFGVSPLQYLQTRRLLAAKQMLTDTMLPVSDVAAASGFASVRRFNACFQQHYRMSPTALRRVRDPATNKNVDAANLITLAYRPPYDIDAMASFFAQRQLTGLDHVEHIGDSWTIARTLRLADRTGWIHIRFLQDRPAIALKVCEGLITSLPAVIARVRSMLDLDADPHAIDAVIGASFPGKEGLRVPGGVSGFEIAVRAILGQQVTVAAGRTFTQRVLHTFGERFATPYPQLTHLFPTPQTLAKAPASAIGDLGIVRQRQAAIIALSQAVASGTLDLDTPVAWTATIEQLKALPGFGDWTAQYIAMRALRWPDAFPAGDVALQNALDVRGDTVNGELVKYSATKAARLAEEASIAWRPWRSYAVIRAWASLSKDALLQKDQKKSS